MTPPLQFELAQERLLADVEPLPAEILPVEQAIGRFLAAPLLAARTQPAVDLSAMDGWAVNWSDGDCGWVEVGESAAGHPYSGALSPGDAVRISTGALMPDGANGVVLQEDVLDDAGLIHLLPGKDGPSDRHIRRKGFDFREGDVLLDAGVRLGPAQLALALAAGRPTLDVHRRPRVAVLDSGDELVADAANCAPHQIPASNGAMLAAMAAPWAAEVARLGPVPDTMEAMLAALDAAGEAEVIVTSGGASVGDHDLVWPALEEWGATVDFWRVAIRPGKPLLVARKGPQRIIGLPGNPVSSYVTAFLFMLPVLRRLGGAAHSLPRPFRAPLATPLFAVGERTEFVRAQCVDGALAPIAERDSSALLALSRADALIERGAGSPTAATGEVVKAYWLENGGIA